MNNAKKKKIILGLVVLAMFALVWFVWYSIGLYKEKKMMEEYLAANKMQEEQLEKNKQNGIIVYDGKEYERNPSVKAILCIGVDSSGELHQTVTGSGGDADGVFIVAHDVARDTLKILMIPRDTMTPITLTDLSGNVLGKDVQHLTLAFAYGDGRELSCERMEEAVSELLSGLPLDGYIAMNTSAISVLNDVAGGIKVHIDTDGMEKRDPELIKGKDIVLNGKQAEIFVRYRDINIDHSAITRMSQQKQYMQEFFQTVRMKAVKDDTLIPNLMSSINEYMITDLSKDQYMSMGTAILKNNNGLSGEDILTIPGEAVTTQLYDEFHYDEDGTLKMVLDLFYREKN